MNRGRKKDRKEKKEAREKDGRKEESGRNGKQMEEKWKKGRNKIGRRKRREGERKKERKKECKEQGMFKRKHKASTADSRIQITTLTSSP